MNAVQKEWVRRLREDNLKQTTGQLTTDYKTDGMEHCCLGVGAEQACDAGVARRVTHEELPNFLAPGQIGYADANLTNDQLNNANVASGTLSLPVLRDFLGIRTETGNFTRFGSASNRIAYRIDTSTERYATDLTALNDSAHYSFAEIADVIERLADDLFWPANDDEPSIDIPAVYGGDEPVYSD